MARGKKSRKKKRAVDGEPTDAQIKAEKLPPDVGEWDDDALQAERAAEIERENTRDAMRK